MDNFEKYASEVAAIRKMLNEVEKKTAELFNTMLDDKAAEMMEVEKGVTINNGERT